MLVKLQFVSGLIVRYEPSVGTSVANTVRRFPLVGKELLIPGPPLILKSFLLPSAITAPSQNSQMCIFQQLKLCPLAH